MEIRRSYDRLISTMEFPMLVRWHLYILNQGPGDNCPVSWPIVWSFFWWYVYNGWCCNSSTCITSCPKSYSEQDKTLFDIDETSKWHFRFRPHTCQVTLDISESPIDFQWGAWKYPCVTWQVRDRYSIDVDTSFFDTKDLFYQQVLKYIWYG